MTGDRWDTRGHVDDDEHRRRPTTKRRYHPWHDATMAVDGKVAEALGEHARSRWQAAGGETIERPAVSSDPWPTELEPEFRDVEVAIARTRGEHDEEQCLREIEALYVDLIRSAKRFFYAENQYFASRVIAKAICDRLEEDDPPEFVIVNPHNCDGWLEDAVMSGARAELMEAVRKCDRHGRFGLYYPVTEGREDIYVHSKITIVDDRLIRVGSANLNNRSMGLDSECDLLIDAGAPGNEGASEVIAARRADLLAEHLGASADTIEARLAQTGSHLRTIASFGSSQGRGLVTYIPEKPGPAERALAESQALDPESAGEEFEPMARPGLLARLGA
jgi:phosphatidylserine/phosphatidylglycerophosphate/cardiolipin synthase-like enzyme